MYSFISFLFFYDWNLYICLFLPIQLLISANFSFSPFPSLNNRSSFFFHSLSFICQSSSQSTLVFIHLHPSSIIPLASLCLYPSSTVSLHPNSFTQSSFIFIHPPSLLRVHTSIIHPTRPQWGSAGGGALRGLPALPRTPCTVDWWVLKGREGKGEKGEISNWNNGSENKTQFPFAEKLKKLIYHRHFKSATQQSGEREKQKR